MVEKIYDFEIEGAVKKNNIHYWEFSKCSICGEGYGFYFNGDEVTFNGACGCGSIFGERQASYQEIADIYNRNKNDEFRRQFLEYFKLNV